MYANPYGCKHQQLFDSRDAVVPAASRRGAPGRPRARTLSAVTFSAHNNYAKERFSDLVKIATSQIFLFGNILSDSVCVYELVC